MIHATWLCEGKFVGLTFMVEREEKGVGGGKGGYGGIM